MNVLNDFPAYLLVLVRMTCFLMTAPVFSYRAIPTRFKVGLAAVFSLLITITLSGNAIKINGDYSLLLMKEAVVGLAIGFVGALLLYALQVAGAFIDLQMGFAMANLIDPGSGMQTPITGQFFYIIMVVFFFSVDAHHMFLNGIYYSFQLIPLSQLTVPMTDGQTVHMIIELFVKMFAIALQMALPIVACLFLVDVAVGLVARTVPQINVFVVGLPLKIGVGLLILFIAAPLYVMLIRELFDWSAEGMKNFMTWLGSP
ncbi:flagellar biosynthetic protein FliR [Camelliibacillus cellulosilyticus]|uniref:Flagellar biosynthetic protein FliR n=1 Tax=Camelliibacillus cellulosilyticus TaxID=2174486 RepID=A0ABV9GJR9_9BACL